MFRRREPSWAAGGGTRRRAGGVRPDAARAGPTSAPRLTDHIAVPDDHRLCFNLLRDGARRRGSCTIGSGHGRVARGACRRRGGCASCSPRCWIASPPSCARIAVFYHVDRINQGGIAAVIGTSRSGWQPAQGVSRKAHDPRRPQGVGMMDDNFRGMGAWSTRGDDDASPTCPDLALDQLLTVRSTGRRWRSRRAHLARARRALAATRGIEEDARRLLAARPTLGEAAATPASRGAAPLLPRCAAARPLAAAGAPAVRGGRRNGGGGRRAGDRRRAGGEGHAPQGTAARAGAVRAPPRRPRRGFCFPGARPFRARPCGWRSPPGAPGMWASPASTRAARSPATRRASNASCASPPASGGSSKGASSSTRRWGRSGSLAVLCPERLEVSRLLAAVRERAAAPAADPAAAGRDAVSPELGLGCQQTSFAFLKVAAR